MTPEEFNQWLLHHQAAFPGVAKWFANIPAEIRPKTLALWQAALQRITLEAATAATDTMLAESDRPRYYEDHPAAILLRARRDKKPETFQPRRTIDGQEVFRCLVCEDTGCIVCWHPAAMVHYRDHGNLEDCGVRTCVRACTCAAGDKHAQAYGRFNAEKWLPYGNILESERMEKLHDFVACYKNSKRERAFDAFAQ